ncbi:ArsR family transcriptional regulator [Candidatus Parcubacteria bacterium]|nr:ArsR family transcriptional regulator [Candidatus Parcubacteria bacterium]
MAKTELKDTEKIHKALANRRRLAAVRYLKSRREANLTGIAEHLHLSYKATSKHLALLIAADIVEKEQRSVQMFFRISKNIPDLAKHTLSAL